jgi:hypothetical protein
VFNVEQTEGVKFPATDETPERQTDLFRMRKPSLTKCRIARRSNWTIRRKPTTRQLATTCT